MRLVLLPQAVTAMMPAIVSQLVVLLKDTALGYIIAYVDLLNMGFKIIPAVNFGSLIPAAIVIGIIYVGLNMALSALANWLEKRSRRSRKTSARPIVPPGAVALGGHRGRRVRGGLTPFIPAGPPVAVDLPRFPTVAAPISGADCQSSSQGRSPVAVAAPPASRRVRSS